MPEGILRDIRYAARALRRVPGFTAAAVITLALGIGANAAVFSVVDGVLLNPLPFREPSRLVALYSSSALEPKASISYLNFLDWQQNARSFAALAVWRQHLFVSTDRRPAEQLFGLMVSANFLRMLAVEPLAGRMFTADEDRLGGAPVVVLGESFWERRFARDPGVIGQTLSLGGQRYTVVGIAPRSVQLVGADVSRLHDIVVPIGQYADPIFRERGAGLGSHGLARLADGVTLPQAQAEMNAIARAQARDYPDANADKGIQVLRFADDVAGDVRPTLLALFAAVGFVLLVACANVANLLLARNSSRSREIAVRLALGGSRARLLRQLLAEGLLLSTIGGIAGVALAAWGTRVALQILPDALPAISSVGLNLRVLGFAFAASIATGAIVAVVPAWKETSGLVLEGLRGGRGVTTTHHRTLRAIIVGQVALTLMLLLGAGLMIRSLSQVWNVAPGFDPDRVLTFFTALTGERAASADRVRAALDDLSDRLAAIPGVEKAGIVVGPLPMRGKITLSFWRADRPQPKNSPETVFSAVGPDYLAAMRIPLRRGRFLERGDIAERPRVAVVDEVFVRETFPGEDPIGKRVEFDGFQGGAEIVGVVGHITHTGLDKDATEPVRAQLYVPYAQLPDNLATIFAGVIGVVARARVQSPDVIAAIRTDLSAFSGDQVVHTEAWMRDLLSESIANRRFSLAVLGAFAVVALILAVVGVYGTVSYLVRQRTHEIGLRAALGGRPRDLLWMVLSEGGRLGALGVAAGIAGSFATTNLLAALLFGVSATDPATFAAVSIVLLGAVLIACYVPARRAARIDPMTALRAE